MSRSAGALLLLLALHAPALEGQAPETAAAPRNIILILSDDHRHDFMGFMASAPPFLETPNLDRMAAGGAHIANAFVTTALCSPSRASIFTGQYAHRHGVVDNTSPIPEGTEFFPASLQRAGYRTAYIGKWHMGEDNDAPQPGFDHWVSFRGQGVYENPELNIDGARSKRSGYTTDVLTNEAVDWLRRQRAAEPARPFFLVLSHKAVHAEFIPAPRHRGRYASAEIPYPATMPLAAADSTWPRWVRAQRSSWHGVDFMYHGAMRFDEFYRRYAETLLALDEGVGRVLDFLEAAKLDRTTLVLYMGDNGFSLGEHGLIDKRHAYEESMRVPMLAWAPGFIRGGRTITPMVRNIDVAPTILEIASAPAPGHLDGRSILPLLRGSGADWKTELLYEYYWEDAFPHTPTVLALRDDRWKYIYYHGVWDRAELFDLDADPAERRNLADDPAQAERVTRMRNRLFEHLAETGGMRIPLRRPTGWRAAERGEAGDRRQ
ncbi:MAG TPA: sulfatase [Gemmatimonadales bacterium]|nr:sulfatase [Gemmatimonadales bacterium]